MKTTLIIFFLITYNICNANWIGDCWDAWSRCSEWSGSLDGILWNTCDEHCKVNGYPGGSCEVSTSNCPIENSPYQCQCYSLYCDSNKPKITDCEYGFPTCLMPENRMPSPWCWNDVDDSTGIVINGAVCDVSVCGRDGEFRAMGVPVGSTYIESPTEGAAWGRYCTNGIYETEGKARYRPGSTLSITPFEFNSKIKAKIGKNAKRNALDKSSGLSAKFVCIAIEAALEEKFPFCDGSPKSREHSLLRIGFEEVQTYSEDGDILVWSAGKDSSQKYGYIQVYYQGEWYSDFKQKKKISPWKYSSGATYKIYRYVKLPW